MKIFENNKKRGIALLLAGTMAGTMCACSKEENVKKEETKDELTSAQVMCNNILDEVEENDIEKTISITDEVERTFATLMNIDYIIAAATLSDDNKVVETSLQFLFPNDKITDEYFEDYERFVDPYRACMIQLENSNGFIGLSKYLVEEDTIDYKVYSAIENITKEIMDDVNAKENYNKIFNFFTQDGTINIEGKEVKKSELSYGAQLAIEEYAKIVNVRLRNVIDQETREELDSNLTNLSSKRYVNALITKFSTNSIDVANLNINLDNVVVGEPTEELINLYKEKLENLKANATGKYNLTDAEAAATVIVANMNYFDVTTLKTLLYENGGLDTVIENFESCAEKVAQSGDTSFNPYFEEDKEDYINNATATMGSIKMINELRGSLQDNFTTQSFDNNALTRYMQLFLSLSDKHTFTYTGENGKKYVVGYNQLTNSGDYIVYELITEGMEDICPESKVLKSIEETVSKYDPEVQLRSDIASKCGESYVKIK